MTIYVKYKSYNKAVKNNERCKKMAVLAYIAEQKAKIRARHSGEEFFFQSASEKNSPVNNEKVRTAGEILREIDSMKGLNVQGRAFFARRMGTAKDWFTV